MGYRALRALSATEPATEPATGSLPLLLGREPLRDTFSVYIACKSPFKTCIFFSSLSNYNRLTFGPLHRLSSSPGQPPSPKDLCLQWSPLSFQWCFASFSTAVVSHLECYPVPCTQPFPLAVASQVLSWLCSLALANPAAQHILIDSFILLK